MLKTMKMKMTTITSKMAVMIARMAKDDEGRFFAFAIIFTIPGIDDFYGFAIIYRISMVDYYLRQELL